MALGPFLSYVPPGVYTRTLTEANVSNIVAGLRLPVIIGVGQEELSQSNVALVRGSSSTLDQQINNEDVALQWVLSDINPSAPVLGEQDGTQTRFRVRHFPIVDGSGIGRVTNDIRSVTVTVNGVPTAIGQLTGQTGIITLQVPTQPTDDVRVFYYFHRGDTAFTDDVSAQVSSELATLLSPAFGPFTVTTGFNDTFKIKVNGVTYTATFPAGDLTVTNLISTLTALNIPNFTASLFYDNMNDSVPPGYLGTPSPGYGVQPFGNSPFGSPGPLSTPPPNPFGRQHLRLTTTSEIQILDGTANTVLGWTNFTKTNRVAEFTVFNRPIVDGSGGGLTTTDPSKVVVKVNGVQVIPTAVDGQNGKIYLSIAPPPNATVTIAYFANTWQDTFDYLPNSLVTTVSLCGYSPDRATYIQDTDFVVANPSRDVSIIHWGTSYSVSSTTTTAGGTSFDETQITGSLNDDEYYMAPCTRVVDSSTVPATISSTDFLLPEVPTMGNGRNTPLTMDVFGAVTNGKQGATTNRPDLVEVYVGRNVADAMSRPAVTVVKVDGQNRRVTLKHPVHPDQQAFATFYYNRVADESYTFTCKVPGPVGVGQYEVATETQQLYHVRFGTKSGLSSTVQWPRGVERVPDAFHTGLGTPVSETVTVTFDQHLATNAAYTSDGAEPYSFDQDASHLLATRINGTAYTTNLLGGAHAYLVGQPVQLDSAGNVVLQTVTGSTLYFKVELDGVTVSIPLSGLMTPDDICTDFNNALSAAFTAGGLTGWDNNPCMGFFQADNSDVVRFILRSPRMPSTTDKYWVKILMSDQYAQLGYLVGQTAYGVYAGGAICQRPSLTGSVAAPSGYSITAGVNDVLSVRIDGIDKNFPLPSGATVSLTDIVDAINGEYPYPYDVIASAGTGLDANKLVLTSRFNKEDSSLVILGGNANATFGFTQGQSAFQGKVSAQTLCSKINNDKGLGDPGTYDAGNQWGGVDDSIAYPSKLNGQTYVTFESQLTGAADSTIVFVDSTHSAFNMMAGLGITPGVDGDSGEDAYDIFTVTSDNAAGSTGTGIPGQTFTAANTGLRFTVLPSSTGSYAVGGSFTLTVNPTFKVSPSLPFYAIPGMELTVANTVGIIAGDTGKVQTFAPTGVEPKIGDTYYLSYKYLKQDFTTRVFRQLKTIEANFGRISAENRVTLAAYLAILNGALLVGIKQVLKVPNTNQANDLSYLSALQELTLPITGGLKPDLIVPLTGSPAIAAQLVQHCEVQSLIQNQSERMGFVGFSANTPPEIAGNIAAGLKSSRVVAFYPDAAVVTLTDEVGQSYDSLVDGTFIAAAVAGAVVSPAVDVATPYTRRRILGFSRLPRVLDPVEANQTAVKGVTLLEDLAGLIRIRQGLTTKMDSILTRLPTVTQIADYVQQNSRQALDGFIGTKFLSSRIQEVDIAMTSLFKQFVQAEIVGAFTGIKSSVDPNDPTILQFEAYYQPIFPLLYIVMTFNLRSQV